MKAGWQTKTLRDVCEVITAGGDVPKGRVSQEHTPQYRFPIYSNGVKNEGLYGFTDVASVLKPSVTISARGTIGYSVIRTEPFFPVVRLIVLMPEEKIVDISFLHYSVMGMDFENTGTSIPQLTVPNIRERQICIPPLPEQQRIVGILDEAFDGIATAKANAEKNLQNVRELFESHLQSVFTQRGDGWMEKQLEDLIDSNIIGLTKSIREQGDDKSWRYVKMNNITRDNCFDFSNFTTVDASDVEFRKFQLEDGDFLFNTRNSYELVGKSCIYEADSGEPVLYNNNIMRIRFIEWIDARFILLAFSSKAVAEKLNSMKSGTTNVSAIYYKDLKTLIIPVPPVAVQKNIANELNVLSAETKHLETIYHQKLSALDALKKSLLDQAFTGAL